MSQVLHRKVRLAFGVAMLTLLFTGAVSYRWIMISGEDSGWTRHTNVVLTKIQDLLLASNSIDAITRQFVLTGDESYLAQFQPNVLKVAEDQQSIRDLTADNPVQQQRLPGLAGLAADNIQNAESIIRLRRTGGLAAAALASGRFHSTVEMQALVETMRDEELRLLAQRRTRSDRDVARTKLILAFGTLLGLLIAGVAALSALRYSRMHKKAEEDLAGKAEELDRSNEELVELAHAGRTMEKQITHSAEHDALTGLPNRLLLSDRVGQAISYAQLHQNQLALLFLDVDGFKHINNSLGQPIGGLLLQSIADRLVDRVTAVDTVSRAGGDEFAVLLSYIRHPEDAALEAHRLLAAVAEPHAVEEHDLHVTASIGIGIYPEDGLDAETLIKNAETAMYEAKENGRQGYQFFRPAMNTLAVERQSIEEHLRRALERNEFTLHYQPKISLETGAIVGAEALIRWNHPTRGVVPPLQFIPVVEDCGLILPVGTWVLREACMQTQVWANAGLPRIKMAVNVSSLQFMHESFVKHLFAILEETGLAPEYLELELTERALMKRPDLAAPILSTLRAAGVQMAVDDFGTGYSSLSYLEKLPLDALKIDQSFVRQITTVPDETVIIRTIISMGRSLNLRVIAEGVETQEQLDFLKANECDEAQGYLFSRPVTAGEFARLLRD